MNIRRVMAAAAVPFMLALALYGQGTVVVNDPTKTAKETKLTAAEQAMIDSEVVPKLKQKFAGDPCEVEIETAGVASGAFTRVGAKQRLAFFQICQTGNGFGFVGLVLIENGKIAGTFTSDGGWSNDIAVVPDIDQNGLAEFVLSFSGGMHQGQGGVGADVMEFAGGVPKGIGWYKAEAFDETQASNVWRLTAKPGKTPVFYRQKFFSGEGEKWRRVGANTVFKLGKPFAKFTRLT